MEEPRTGRTFDVFQFDRHRPQRGFASDAILALYLTSPRLAQSRGDVSRFHVHLNAAHTTLAQACLGTLLRLDKHAGKNSSKGFPLAKYAAQHWVVHGQFEDVS
jgi:hypothetical protein